jgi:hypothetical protein
MNSSTGTKEASFWEARESARAALVAIILVTTLFSHVLLSDATDNLLSLAPVIMAVGVLSISCLLAINTSIFSNNKKHHQSAFSAFIALVSLASMVHYYHVAVLGEDTYIPGTHVVAKRMRNGGLPVHLATTLVLPLVSTPSGMHIQWARYVSMVNFAVFTLIVVEVRRQSVFCDDCTRDEVNDRKFMLLNDILAVIPSFAVAYFSCLP